ncbi:MAG: class I SAM-dependent methyltransferase [Patescibacteria group bacterium]
MSHGNDDFDKKYYKQFFIQYDHKELAKYYNWFWGLYNFLGNYLPLHNQAGKKVLEIGGSMGAFAKVLKEKKFLVVSSDISSFIVNKAKKLQPDIKFTVIDIQKGIYVKGTFDYIFAFDVVEHLKNPQIAFKNILKKLKKGGVFVFSTPFPAPQFEADPTHINIHEPKWWLELAKNVGFKKLVFTYATYIPFLYRVSKYFSLVFPFKINLPFINSTCIFIFRRD